MIPLSVSCAHCIIYYTFLLQTLFHAKDGAPANLHLLHDFRNGCVGEQGGHDLFSLGLHATENNFESFDKKKLKTFFCYCFCFYGRLLTKKIYVKTFFVIVFVFMPVSWILKKIGNFHSLFWNLILKVSNNSDLNHNRNLDNTDTDRKERR